MADTGHNSKEQLRSIVDRIDRLMDDRQQLAEDINDIYREAKSQGYDVPALRAVVKARREDAEKRRAFEALVETYMASLGMLADTPLGAAAAARDLPPAAKLTPADTSSVPFEPPDQPRVAHDGDGIPEFLQR